MRNTLFLCILALLLAAGAQGQQSQQQPALGMAAPTPIEPLDIWQIDLNPSGTGFALTTPIDQGDVYVFKVWPDRATIRLPKTRVKKMVRRTKDVNDEVLWQIDFNPNGQTYSRDEPQQQGGTWLFHSWRLGTLMSVRQSDVLKVSKVTGLAAFKIHVQQLGASAVQGNLAMQGGGNVTVLEPTGPPPGQAPPVSDPNATPSNWIYTGMPGVTDAWAPPSAYIAAPGDVPRARPN